jgi:hypothetical protein
MKQIQAGLICTLTFSWLAASMPVTGQDSFKGANNPPPEITLNGLTSIFDEKRALFKVQPPDSSSGMESYYLAEGQSAGGIKLLSVDMKANRIKVVNHGVAQTISLHHSTDSSTLIATGSRNSVEAKNLEIKYDSSAHLPNTQIAVVAGQYSGAGYIGGGAAASANDAASANSGAKKGGYSLAAARQFEQLRIQTAAAVYDGTSEPIPLTPLTPLGTPPALIGSDKAWFPD